MFGYVLPSRPQMSQQDFETYRNIYCGLCKQLGKSFGQFSRFLLNYDLVLVALLADALSGEAGTVQNEGCVANPVAKHATLHKTGGLALAADGLILLSYHKLQDNLLDEKSGKYLLSWFAHPFLKSMYRKAAKRCPDIDAVLFEEMQRQQALEAAGCTNLDEACEPTAKMCAAIFLQTGRTNEEKAILERLGLFAGQIVYMLDAAEDFEDDVRQGRYNVLVLAGYSQEDALSAVRRRCNMAAGEIALCYNQLCFRQYKSILDNIFFLGLPQGIKLAGAKRGKRRTNHGQIQSV